MISGGTDTAQGTGEARRAAGLAAAGIATAQALVAVNLLGVQRSVFGSEAASLDPRLLAENWVPAQLTTLIQVAAGLSLAAFALALHRLLAGKARDRMVAATVAGVVAGVLFVTAGAAHASGVQAARRLDSFYAAGGIEALAASDIGAAEVMATALRVAGVLALSVAVLLWAPVAARERVLPRAACAVALLAAAVGLLGVLQYEALFLAGALVVVWAAWVAVACLSPARPGPA